MTKLVETIAKSLVDNPDQVIVSETLDEKGSILQLQVAGSDMGKVIGKQGRIAKALRTVVKAAATREKKKVIVEIVSEDEQNENVLSENEQDENAPSENEQNENAPSEDEEN